MDNAIIAVAFGLLGGFIAKLVAGAGSKATTFGTASAASIGSFIDKTVPAELRPAVLTELKALSTSGPLAASSVTGVAATILAKIGPQFPTAVKDDITLILGDYVKAFDAGLANVT